MDSSSSFPAFFFVLLITIGFGPCLSSSQCYFPALFNFGDSNSDTGGLSAAFGAAGPPHGSSFFGGPAGRYCDGRLIVDFIAEAIGLPYINAYLDSVGTNFSHGANFATAGSCIRAQNTTLFEAGFSPISLDVQQWEFDQFMTRSQAAAKKSSVFKGLLPHQDYFSRALYTFDIGQNDLTAGYFLGWSVDEVRANIPDILDKFTTMVKNLHWVGARYFWIHNTGPVGCLPYIMDRLLVTAAQVDEHGCATPFNEVAQYFNARLKERVQQLRRELPDAAFTYADVYSVKLDLFQNAAKHGFNNPLRACCGHGGKYNFNQKIGCGSKINVDGKEYFVDKCSQPWRAVNWDGVHFTQAANQFIFDRIVSGAFSDPPIPITMACQGKMN
ncbi:Alpha-L-fucosidase 3 [Asimina triloba]